MKIIKDPVDKFLIEEVKNFEVYKTPHLCENCLNPFGNYNIYTVVTNNGNPFFLCTGCAQNVVNTKKGINIKDVRRTKDLKIEHYSHSSFKQVG